MRAKETNGRVKSLKMDAIANGVCVSVCMWRQCGGTVRQPLHSLATHAFINIRTHTYDARSRSDSHVRSYVRMHLEPVVQLR